MARKDCWAYVRERLDTRVCAKTAKGHIHTVSLYLAQIFKLLAAKSGAYEAS